MLLRSKPFISISFCFDLTLTTAVNIRLGEAVSSMRLSTPGRKKTDAEEKDDSDAQDVMYVASNILTRWSFTKLQHVRYLSHQSFS